MTDVTVVTVLAGQGLFHCPRCGGDRRYRRRAGRRFLTLFFIPVIPLTRAGEHVRCTTCRARYHAGARRVTRRGSGRWPAAVGS
jgi:predicted RNA-binding Zn-ribbon protein involved in translation (DUF1610 family)